LMVVSAACTSEAPLVPLPGSMVIASEHDVAGCYEVISLKWTRRLPTLEAFRAEPPQVFQLAMEPHPLGRRRIIPRTGDAVHSFASWRLIDKTVEVLWRSDDAVVRATLQRKGSNTRVLEGRADWLDAARAASVDGEIALRRVPDATCS
jgi:hypothetical protein